ncbi:MAG: P-loop NTPase [Thermoplasmata archaeon]|nr:MAG: P-loop NTPase [Thermoplasmata archaeon]
MKLAVSGKGGVGKTTIAAYLARMLSRDNNSVLAVDADPSPSLASALGVPEQDRKNLIPITKMTDLIEERTGLPPTSSSESSEGGSTTFGKIFTLNPKVDDIANRFAIKCKDNVKLLVLGTIDTAGAGCFCPENALLKSLLRHLILKSDEYVILDMEAGTEHLGRGTAKGLDLLIIVVEPGRRAVETAIRIKKLANDLEISSIGIVLNKINSELEEKELREQLSGLDLPILAAIPYNINLVEADLHDESPFDYKNTENIFSKMKKLKERIHNMSKQ